MSEEAVLGRLFGKPPEPSCSNNKVQMEETSSKILEEEISCEEDPSSTGKITNFGDAARFRCDKCFKILNTNSFCSQIKCGLSWLEFAKCLSE